MKKKKDSLNKITYYQNVITKDLYLGRSDEPKKLIEGVEFTPVYKLTCGIVRPFSESASYIRSASLKKLKTHQIKDIGDSVRNK